LPRKFGNSFLRSRASSASSTGKIIKERAVDRTAILKHYDVDVNGRIRSPGKFEGEMLYVPYFWDVGLDGFADTDNGTVWGFKVTKEDKLMFPELKRKRSVRLAERDDGFVVEV
jgi:hypothetical protein